MNMRHVFSLPSSQLTTTTTTQILIRCIYPLYLQKQFLSPTSVPLLRCCYGGKQFNLFVFAFHPNCKNYRRKQRCRVGGRVRASGRETPYDVLGVSPSSTPNEIKRAYRKLALKYHPDVNKEANAQEKFMRIKNAYNTLLSSDSRRRYDSGNRTSDFSYSSAGRSWSAQEEEDFYGFGDFFRDVQEEFRNWEANASTQGKPKSLWEELAEIGEELVEFLEKELNIADAGVDIEIEGATKDNAFGAQTGGSGVENKAGEGKSSIEESIDEVQATLAKLKKELGL